ncbi:Serine/threonine-protein kinase haspin hrk1 [Dichotomopilus funicola]|uniref:non-specific serine/threonine protein kinase n=1 Tax=Dichotomopilus funicola TaxID=1934379 RepID=A0AAN6ZPL8_9PEZI|nr:Serine/threonine-protein kinase haspin hrk1 [Dichotomopilus funicola]
MTRTTTLRKYGRTTRKQTAEALFAELPKSPVRSELGSGPELETGLVSSGLEMEESGREMGTGLEGGDAELSSERQLGDEMVDLAQQLESTVLEERAVPRRERERDQEDTPLPLPEAPKSSKRTTTPIQSPQEEENHLPDEPAKDGLVDEENSYLEEGETSLFDGLRTLTWSDVCTPHDRIDKIAEASFAEVYRITNAQGTSIIKVVRLSSPIKPQTKAQQRSGLVDEEPHDEEDMQGELRISEWLADIPGFVVYKEQYVVKGKGTKALLETHQAFQKKVKRQDPDRLQFYPSPSRYLEETRFLVVELGDAGTALEDFELSSVSQVWDIFLHTALALARAEDMVEFEHRDLHEGNLCIRRVRPPKPKPATEADSERRFGFSGLDITILDYGLSRATDPDSSYLFDEDADDRVVAYDLEKDLPLFQSTHAPQCQIYRQMRSHLISHDRVPLLPPSQHTTPYPISPVTNRPISWRAYRPYTNVLWLAYFSDRAALRQFRRETAELRAHLDPAAPRGVLSFPSAGEVVRFAVEAGWIGEEQVVGGVWGEGGSRLEGSKLENDELSQLGADGGGQKGGEVQHPPTRIAPNPTNLRFG